VRHLSYLGVLLACLLATLPLELWLGVRVYRQRRRLLLTVAPVFAVFVVWDLWATATGQWSFDRGQTVGPDVGGVPLEELLFFVVIPICAVLAFEAVRTVRAARRDSDKP
jgi:lycopene cyclase domain-containing protein